MILDVTVGELATLQACQQGLADCKGPWGASVSLSAAASSDSIPETQSVDAKED